MSEEATRQFLALEVLDRAAHRRGDVEWLGQQLANSAQFLFIWRECNLFGTDPEKRPLFLEGPGPAISHNPIFLGILPKGGALFAVNLGARLTEKDALASLALTPDQARFIPLRQFDGS